MNLIPAKEALRRCGYRHRNSLRFLIKKVGPAIKQNGRYYFSEDVIDQYLTKVVVTDKLTPSERIRQLNEQHERDEFIATGKAPPGSGL